MSQTPIPTISSPLKRSNTIDDISTLENDAKRARLNDSTLNIDDIESSSSGLILPPSSENINISSPANLDIALQLSVPSQPSSSLSTPLQVPIELPESGLHLPIQSLPNTSTANTPVPSSLDKDELTKSKNAADPEKLSDALLAAGVDLKAEEALLTSTVNNLPSKPGVAEDDDNINKPIVLNTPFLNPLHLAVFMNKIIRNNGSRQTFEQESQILELVSSSCEQWLTEILSSSILTSRHRRRSIKNRKRSDISKALRDISIHQKQTEERRTEKKKNNGITSDDKEKEDIEEDQHKATNATVAMMTGKKKKYSWMTGGSNAASSRNMTAGANAAEGGIRFREAREEPGIAVRDLLTTLERKRMGVEKTIVKGYAKLKD